MTAVRRGSTELEEHLFRLDEDPTESRNLLADHPEKLEELRAMVREFPRAPTVSPDLLEPALRRARGAGGAPGKAGRRGPGRGTAPPEGWKEITREPWALTAKRD